MSVEWIAFAGVILAGGDTSCPNDAKPVTPISNSTTVAGSYADGRNAIPVRSPASAVNCSAKGRARNIGPSIPSRSA